MTQPPVPEIPGAVVGTASGRDSAMTSWEERPGEGRTYSSTAAAAPPRPATAQPPSWSPRVQTPPGPGYALGDPTGPRGPAAGAPAPEVEGRRSRSPGPRRARLVLRRVDPWSVLKFSLVFSICLVIAGVVAVAIVYSVVDSLGVFDSVAKFIDTLTDAQAGSSTRSDFRGSIIIGGAAVLLAIGAVLFTALATLGAFVYNLCASLTGGLEVTLTERG